jgi:hypothetical protein
MKSMRLLHLLIIFTILALFIPARHPVLAQSSAQEIPEDAQFVPGEVVVTFAQGLSASTYSTQASALARTVGANVVRRYQNMALLSFGVEADVAALASTIPSVARVESAQPNYVYRIPEKGSDVLAQGYRSPNYQVSGDVSLSWDELKSLRISTQGSPTFPNEIDNAWGWDRIQADIIWNTPASTAQVCLLDTGVDTAHPDMTAMFVTGYDFVNNDTTPNDDNGHGTHLAGIILAKANNGSTTAIGVANTKIVPVKVAGAQGWGTTFNIAAGLRFCAGLSAVKVINLSLGSRTPDGLLYNTVNYTIGRGKLIVAAAGNDSLSYLDCGSGSTTCQPAFFPAGWAHPKVASTGIYNPSGSDNAVYKGLISVGAGRDPGVQTWVDTVVDPDVGGYGTIQEEELFYDCAWKGSNYGNWVNLVAPGSNIYSTTPKSYPFYLGFFAGVPSPYGYMSGTSQAAAFVSGAASRVWGVYSAMSNEQVKNRLVYSGTPLNLVTQAEASLAGGFDENFGFNNDSGIVDLAYGQDFNRVDPLLTEPPFDTQMAPFCWSNATSPFLSEQDMSETRYLNVAAAMARVAFWATVRDATNGIPLAGSIVRTTVGTTQKATATVPAGLTRSAPNLALINIPLDVVQSPAGVPANSYVPKTTSFNFLVSKTGYTVSYQQFNSAAVSTTWSGSGTPVINDALFANLGKFYFDPYNIVSLAPNTLLRAVVDWSLPEAGVPNLDAYLWLPPSAMGGAGGIIGTPDSTYDFGGSNFLGGGTLLDPSKTGASYSPYALYNFDGGAYTGFGDADGYPIFSAPMEALTVGFSTSRSTTPYLAPKLTGEYTFMLTADDPGWLTDDGTYKPVVRLWAKGNLIRTFKIESMAGCDGTQTWWKVFTYSGYTVTASGGGISCGNDPGILPY